MTKNIICPHIRLTKTLCIDRAVFRKIWQNSSEVDWLADYLGSNLEPRKARQNSNQINVDKPEPEIISQ